MDIRFDMDAIAKIIDEVYADEEVVTAPAFKCIFNNVDELSGYLAARKKYINYCKDTGLPMAKMTIWP